MSDTVSWILALAVKEGELENLRNLMAEMVEHTKNEPGALTYEWFVSDDGSAVHIYERYADSAAVLAHLGGFGEHFAERFMAAADPTGFHVYGNPDDTARGALLGQGAEFFGPFGGFAH
ncbi:MAG: putative quinol monooxygenase [Acidimicrobiia bacterium]